MSIYVPSLPRIDGQIKASELVWLYAMASQMGSVVEVGSYKGRSTQALLEGCRGLVVCVDTWDDGRNEGEDNVFKDFVFNVGHYANLKIERARSVDAAAKTGPADMVFIDADHTYDEIRADVDAWLPLARKLICGHDYFDAPHWGVIRAVHETFGERVRVFESIWYVLTEGVHE